MVHTQNFEQNFYQCVIVYLVRIWTYKNAVEKANTFSRRSKNVQNGQKRILYKFTLMLHSVEAVTSR